MLVYANCELFLCTGSEISSEINRVKLVLDQACSYMFSMSIDRWSITGNMMYASRTLCCDNMTYPRILHKVKKKHEWLNHMKALKANIRVNIYCILSSNLAESHSPLRLLTMEIQAESHQCILTTWHLHSTFIAQSLLHTLRLLLQTLVLWYQ